MEDSVSTSRSQYCILGGMNCLLSDVNDMDCKTTLYFSSFSFAAAVVFAYPWVRRDGVCTVPNRVRNVSFCCVCIYCDV